MEPHNGELHSPLYIPDEWIFSRKIELRYLQIELEQLLRLFSSGYVPDISKPITTRQCWYHASDLAGFGALSVLLAGLD